MKIDFTPRLERIPIAAATQIGQTAIGAIQSIAGAIQQRRATRQLEKMQSPAYRQNQSILDFYNKALAKYNVNPYQTDLYRMQEQQANRGLASGLSALSGRGMALAGINNLVQARNDSLLKAGASAEQQQAQALSQLGQASGMKTAEDQRAFEINQQQPFERKYNLLAMKAQGGTQIANAGLSNIVGGLQGLGQMGMLKDIYGIGEESTSTLNRNLRTPGMTNMDVYNRLLQNQRIRVQ